MWFSDRSVEWKEYDAKYPEFTRIAAEKCLKILRPYLSPYLGKEYHHMGSTAIVGMSGKPYVDFSIVTKGLHPNFPNDIINELKKIGWEYMGPAPHSQDLSRDIWFLYLNSPEEK
jgi:GrpB-like predicted nucleotidyltransferase (UPF0157 family)